MLVNDWDDHMYRSFGYCLIGPLLIIGPPQQLGSYIYLHLGLSFRDTKHVINDKHMHNNPDSGGECDFSNKKWILFVFWKLWERTPCAFLILGASYISYIYILYILDILYLLPQVNAYCTEIVGRIWVQSKRKFSLQYIVLFASQHTLLLQYFTSIYAMS